MDITNYQRSRPNIMRPIVHPKQKEREIVSMIKTISLSVIVANVFLGAINLYAINAEQKGDTTQGVFSLLISILPTMIASGCGLVGCLQASNIAKKLWPDLDRK